MNKFTTKKAAKEEKKEEKVADVTTTEAKTKEVEVKAEVEKVEKVEKKEAKPSFEDDANNFATKLTAKIGTAVEAVNDTDRINFTVNGVVKFVSPRNDEHLYVVGDDGIENRSKNLGELKKISDFDWDGNTILPSGKCVDGFVSNHGYEGPVV